MRFNGTVRFCFEILWVVMSETFVNIGTHLLVELDVWHVAEKTKQ